MVYGISIFPTSQKDCIRIALSDAERCVVEEAATFLQEEKEEVSRSQNADPRAKFRNKYDEYSLQNMNFPHKRKKLHEKFVV